MSISLVKGQKISLEKESGNKLSKVVMGLGWDASSYEGIEEDIEYKEGAEIDLDASCVMFDENKQIVDTVWFSQLKSKDGSVVHTGDNLTGEGEGDDEQIIADLSRIPNKVKTLVFIVNSFSGEDFNMVENAFCRIVDYSSGKEIAKYDLSCQGDHTAMVMAKVYKHNGEWKMEAIGRNCDGEIFEDLLPVIREYL